MKINPVAVLIPFYLVLTACSSPKSDNDNNLALEEIMGLMASDLEWEVKSNNLYLDYLDDLTSINTEDNFLDFAKGTHSVFLRISDRHCGLCIEDEIGRLKELQSLLKESKIGVLATFDNKRSLSLLTDGIDELKIPIFMIAEGIMKLPIEELVSPYYFCLNESLLTNQMFIPQKSFPELTKAYFSGISYSH